MANDNRCRWTECEMPAVADGDCGHLHCEECSLPILPGASWYDVLARYAADEARQTYGGGVGYPTTTLCEECWKNCDRPAGDLMDNGVVS